MRRRFNNFQRTLVANTSCTSLCPCNVRAHAHAAATARCAYSHGELLSRTARLSSHNHRLDSRARLSHDGRIHILDDLVPSAVITASLAARWGYRVYWLPVVDVI